MNDFDKLHGNLPIILDRVWPKHNLFKALYYILAKFKNYTLFYFFFQLNALKILFYRVNLSKRIKSTLFLLFFSYISYTC